MTNVITESNIASMMQAILQIAKGQNKIEQSVDDISKRIVTLEDKCFKNEDDIIKMFREYISLSPDELELANTQGYHYDGVIETMSIKEIKSRLRRLDEVKGTECDHHYYQWRKRVCNSIGKSFTEIRCEAIAFCIKTNPTKCIRSFCDSIGAIPDYLKWGTICLLDIEHENGISRNLYTRYDLFKSQSKEFFSYNVGKLDKYAFKAWIERRFKDFAVMCNTDYETAKRIAYSGFRRIGERAKNRTSAYGAIGGYGWGNEYTGDMDTDLEKIMNFGDSEQLQNMKSHFTAHIEKCLVV